MPLAQNDKSRPRTMSLDPNWRCFPPVHPVPITEEEAIAKLNKVTQLMFGKDASSALGDYTYQNELDALMQGGNTTACIASVATGTEFATEIWQIAVGAAFDFCAKILGIDQSLDAPALKEGMVCNYFNPAVNSNVQATNFGWMIASLVQQQACIDVDPNCDYMPSPLPSSAYVSPCTAGEAESE